MAIKPKDKKIMDHLVMVDPKALGVLRWEFLALSTINDLLSRLILHYLDVAQGKLNMN